MSPTKIMAIAASAVLAAQPSHAGSLAPKILHSFTGGADGASPYAGLIFHGADLYGTTPLGGSACGGAGCGTVFKVNPKSGVESVVQGFTGSDGQAPFGGLLQQKGTFYGTTSTGGASASGTVFKLDAKTGAETPLYSFAGGTDGTFPATGLIYHGGKLYGTTLGGGASGDGTVFAVDAATGAESVLYSFAGGADGAAPYAGLIYLSGALYGTTTVGGAADCGTVFEIDIKTGAETVLYSFAGGTDGQNPYAALIDVSGTLYGTTVYGGTTGNGTVFTIDPQTDAEAVLYSFKGSPDGAAPYASLLNVSGTLYGTTYYGGPRNSGSLFSIDPATGAETLLYGFKGPKDGANPYAGLVEKAGTLYGTAQYGGKSGYGVVFSITP